MTADARRELDGVARADGGSRQRVRLAVAAAVETGLPPQDTIRSDSAISRGSGPMSLPTPAFQPDSAGVTQIVVCWRL